MESLEGIKHIVCVASGKGGVGKSTTAVNLALALQQQGLRVGLLDADIYGPSLPLMLGVAPGTRPEVLEGQRMVPIQAHGLATNSMGYLVDSATAMVWRAPMIVGALNQMLRQTQWPALDYLIIDMPPGTGDIQLSLAQSLKLTGAVVVTTPQDVALLDARKGIAMFEKVRVPVLGIVENMSMHICSNCGHTEALFGAGGGERLARETGVSLLGQIPLDLHLREHSDAGTPIVSALPDSPVSAAYRVLAQQLQLRVAAGPAAGPAAPTINVVDD